MARRGPENWAPDFNGATDVSDPVGAILMVPCDGEGDVPVQEVGLVLVVLIFPWQTKFLVHVTSWREALQGCGRSHLCSGVGLGPAGSSHRHILVGGVDGHRDGLVGVELVSGDRDGQVHVSHDTAANRPVTLRDER